MKKILLMALLLSCLAACVRPAASGELRTCSIHSDILGEDVPYNVYLPAGFDRERETPYPIVYLLHGLTDTYEAWEANGHMKSVADSLIANGEAAAMVIVMPNAGGPDVHQTWNGYFNMPGHNYEDFFFNELMPSAESTFNAGGDKSRRAVMGLSMGGGGSTVYAQRHPDMFSSCYAMSPWLDNDNNDVGSLSDEDKFGIVCRSVHEHSAIDFVANAGEPTLERLRGVKWFIDCGDDDFLLHLTFRFYTEMRMHDVPAELRVRDGVHNWIYWNAALKTALPFATAGFGSPE